MRSRRTSPVAVLLVALAACSDGDAGPVGGAGEAGEPGAPGAPGVEGERGARGPSPERPQLAPSLAACFPSALYLGHPATITLSGQDTSFSDPELALGEGVSVATTAVASPTAIVADVVVDLDADLGAKDVSVRDGDVELSLPSALDVRPSLEVVATSGTRANGSSFLVDLAATDPSFPLDEQSLRASLTVVEGISVQLLAVEPWNARLRITTDVATPATTLDVVFEQADGEGTLGFRAPAAVEIEEREPVLLDLGALPTGVDAPAGSHLYAIEPPVPTSKVALTVTASSGSGSPRLVILPSSGRVAELVATGTTATFIAAGDGPYYVIVIDDSGAGDYAYDLSAVVTPSPTPETEPNDACGAGDAVAAFPTSILGALADEDDADWYAVTIGAAQAGMRLRSRTVAGDALTDVELTVFDADCTTVLAGPRDIDLHENLLSEALPEGDVHVRVRPSQLFPYQAAFYELTLGVEP